MAVTLYSTATCPYCRMARSYLEELGVDFVDMDVGADEEAAREMIEKSDQMGVPVLEVGEVVMVGFEREAVRNVLADAGLLSG